MANTGHDWGAWANIDADQPVTLTTAGTITDTSDAVDLDIKSACEVSIDADYSDHAKATGGLSVYVARDINDTDYEVVADGAWGFEMPFTQAGTHRRAFAVDPGQIGKFKIITVWANTTGSSNVAYTIKVRTASVPLAS